VDNPRTMKTTQIHDDGAASTRREPTGRCSVISRLRARIGAGDRQRGAVAVEFALLLPILVMLSFGIIEFSSAYHDESVASDAARAGARVGSAMATQAGMPAAVVSAVNSAVSSLPNGVPKELWIYQANAAGYPGSGTGFSSCSGNCIKYTYSTSSNSFTGGTGSWPTTAQQVCTQPYDQIGVYVKLQHPFVTNLFGTSVTLTDHAVFRFEPVASSQCSS
jgi:Flp pilus assembly protein TadG